MVNEGYDQIVSLIGGRLNFYVLGGRVLLVLAGDPPAGAIFVHGLDVVSDKAPEGLTNDGMLRVGAVAIIQLAEIAANRGKPARSGKVIMDRLLSLFSGSALAPEMIKATLCAALEHPGLAGENTYFTSLALSQMQDSTNGRVEVEIEGLPKITKH